MVPKIKGNPLYISVYLLVGSYFFGEFIFPKYNLFYFINILGLMGLIISTILFFSAFNLFSLYNENPRPATESKRLIKTGIFAYTRNPIYLSFVMFHISMFLLFENVMYFLSAVGLSIWLHNYVIKEEENFLKIDNVFYFLCSIGLYLWINNYIIPAEEEYLKNNFGKEFHRYCIAVKRWLFF